MRNSLLFQFTMVVMSIRFASKPFNGQDINIMIQEIQIGVGAG